MSEGAFIVVVGGGPAGISAAVTLARLGRSVLLVEQRDRLGGAIHRQPASPTTPHVPRLSRHVRAWNGLVGELNSVRDRLTIATSTVFAGVDSGGYVLLDNRRTQELLAVKPQGLILAVGAIENIHPFVGWELPGVLSAGGAQVLLKETGRPLEGSTLLAGSGPLLLALGSQLCAMGSAPVAVLERGDPISHLGAAASMLRYPPHVAEGLSYVTQLARARVPYHVMSHIRSVERSDDGLTVVIDRKGKQAAYRVKNLVVHDGVRSGQVSIKGSELPFPILEAGDGREILGADLAVVDGRRAAADLCAALGSGTKDPGAYDRQIEHGRRMQRTLAEIFSFKPAPIPAETILCRCEAKRAGDLPIGATAREAKLVGRFGMGVCQGRFCSDATARELGQASAASEFRPAVVRWPIRPLTAAAVARLRIVSSNPKEIWNDEPAKS